MRSVKLNSRNNLFTGDRLKDVPYCNSVQIKIFVEDGKFNYEPASVYLSCHFVLAKWTVTGYEVQEDISC